MEVLGLGASSVRRSRNAARFWVWAPSSTSGSDSTRLSPSSYAFPFWEMIAVTRSGCAAPAGSPRARLIEYLDRVPLETDRLCEGFDRRRDFRTCIGTSARRESRRSRIREIGCDHMVLVGQSGISPRYMCDEVGKPWSRSMVGPFSDRLHGKNLGAVDDGMLIPGHSLSPQRIWCGKPDADVVSATFCSSMPSDVLTDKKMHYRCYTLFGAEV